MTTLPIVACSLDAADQKQRVAEWSDLLREATRREETADGVRYAFVASDWLESRLRTLATAEKACCAFLGFSIVLTGDDLEMTITAPAGAVPALRSIFSAG